MAGKIKKLFAPYVIENLKCRLHLLNWILKKLWANSKCLSMNKTSPKVHAICQDLSVYIAS